MVRTFSRMGLSFGSLLLSALLFSLFFSGLFRAGSFVPAFHVTMVLALASLRQCLMDGRRVSLIGHSEEYTKGQNRMGVTSMDNR